MAPPTKKHMSMASSSRKVTRASPRNLRSTVSSSSCSEATPSAGASRPRRSGSSRYSMDCMATGMSWAEEAALKRALLASIHGRSSRGKNAAAVGVLTAGLDDDDDESQSDNSFSISSDDDDGECSQAAQHPASKVRMQHFRDSNVYPRLVVPQATRKYATNSGFLESDGTTKPNETSRFMGRKARGCDHPGRSQSPKSVFDEKKGVIYTEDFINYLCSPMSVGPNSSMAPHVGIRSVDGSLSGSSSNGGNRFNPEPSRPRSSVHREHMGMEQPCGDHTSRQSEVPTPVAVPTSNPDSLGCYIYTTLLPPEAIRRGKFVGCHDTALRAEAVLYAKEELRLRKSLRLFNIKEKTFKLSTRNSNTRSSKDPLFISAVPHTCSATGKACYLSLVVANGDVMSTEHAALLGSALASDCKSTLYTLISDVALQAFIKDKRD